MEYFLAADIGATNSRFALFEATRVEGALTLTMHREKWLPTRFPGCFPGLLRQVRRDWGPLLRRHAPAAAVFAPAGPVRNGVCQLSNIDCVVDQETARAVLGVEQTHVINDFAAQGYAVLFTPACAHFFAPGTQPVADLAGSSGRPARARRPAARFFQPLRRRRPNAAFPSDGAPLPPLSRPRNDALARGLWTGTPGREYPVAVVGAGTGFGKALVMPGIAGGPPLVLSSEGGHAQFPFSGDEESRFEAFLLAGRHAEEPTLDMVVSGSGLARLFTFHTGRELPEKAVSAAAEQSPVVLEWFARFYGRVCRNYVLDALALGGLCVTGGVAQRVGVLDHPSFRRAFVSRGKHRHLLEQVPVWHIQSHSAGLWGAALYGALRV